MNLGQALDHIQEWIDNNAVDENGQPMKSRQEKRATQVDFDNF